jgi:hypothetical protein
MFLRKRVNDFEKNFANFWSRILLFFCEIFHVILIDFFSILRSIILPMNPTKRQFISEFGPG